MSITYDELKALLGKQAKRKPRQIEARLQTACVEWFRWTFPDYIIFSVPNGGSRNVIEAANLKRGGALAGVADLIVLAERKVLFVEMKTAKGRQSQRQREFERKVSALGFAYVVCRSLADFSTTIYKWLKTTNK